ncbi:MAG: ethylbenzene dehydrogenase, partial [Anaerolineae bacterium]|nr:ethylbenzene dehydrogenase [Anaerolineae bacterium]
GDIIPGFIVSPFVGSRGDLTANGTWKDGKWVVVLVRALNTGHDDDVSFTPPKPYAFGLSVTDNEGGMKHTIVQGALKLEWQ